MTNCFGREDDAVTHPDNDARADNDARVEERPSNDARARSIACLAHELNNVLTIAIGQLSALQMRVGAELAEHHVDPAIRACRRGGDVARRLAELALHSAVEARDADVCVLPQAANPDAAPASDRRDVVLIVGGDDVVRATRRRDLVEEGFGVLEARDAGEAEALLAAIEEIGAVVLDPAATGDATTREVVARAHGARPELAVVLIARAGDAPALADGVVLPAPVSGAELARAIAHALGSPRAR